MQLLLFYHCDNFLSFRRTISIGDLRSSNRGSEPNYTKYTIENNNDISKCQNHRHLAKRFSRRGKNYSSLDKALLSARGKPMYAFSIILLPTSLTTLKVLQTWGNKLYQVQAPWRCASHPPLPSLLLLVVPPSVLSPPKDTKTYKLSCKRTYFHLKAID